MRLSFHGTLCLRVHGIQFMELSFPQHNLFVQRQRGCDSPIRHWKRLTLYLPDHRKLQLHGVLLKSVRNNFNCFKL
jgi:hypothetical protein